MAIQGNINQLLNTAAYFAKPLGDKKRERQANLAEQQRQEAFEKKQNSLISNIMETSGSKAATDEQLEYAVNLQADMAKRQFEQNPTEETFHNWRISSDTKADVLDEIERDRLKTRMRRDIVLEEERKKFRARLQEEEKKKQEEALLGGKV